jgi:hypothetical protein
MLLVHDTTWTILPNATTNAFRVGGISKTPPVYIFCSIGLVDDSIAAVNNYTATIAAIIVGGFVTSRIMGTPSFTHFLFILGEHYILPDCAILLQLSYSYSS